MARNNYLIKFLRQGGLTSGEGLSAPRIAPDPYDGVNRGGGGGMCVFRWMWIFIWLILECSFCLIVLLIC